MKIIFLDIDGVLNGSDLPPVFSEGWPESHLESHLIERVNRIVETTQAKIVISSSWRVAFPLPDLITMLKNKGLRAEVIDATPRVLPRKFSERVPRGREIQAWLDSAEMIESFVILDDINDMCELQSRLIETNYATGITDVDVELAIRMLGM